MRSGDVKCSSAKKVEECPLLLTTLSCAHHNNMITFPKMWITVALTLVCTPLFVNGFEGEQWSWVQQLRELIEDSEAANIVRQGCLEPYVAVGDQCLFFGTFAEINYEDARQMCHSLDGELAAVLTATHLKNIIDYINDNGLTDRTFWIDGSDQDSEGDWRTSSGLSIPMGTPFWKADGEYQEPNNVKNDENCLEMNNEYYFFMNDIGCSDQLSLICEQPPQDTATVAAVAEVQDCPSFFVSVGGLCLSFMTWVEESWEESRQACHGFSGELAAVTDIEQLRAIYLYLHQEGIAGHSFWLGGSDTAQEGVWLWTDGQRVPMGAPFWGYVKSYVLEPQGGRAENCLLLSYDGFHYFRDYSCSLLRTPLCMYAQ
ncbi:macrophage mannose receptor 1-like isoform X2 [Cherax quadricarinatus]|uniref:macrophage mannose receptor 1-like isoform X2 n=1 Tax=Cherax quadricarinatus TaxID=27406 RepID=UPI00387E3F4F